MNNDFNPPRTSLVQRTRSNRRFMLPLLLLAVLGGLFILFNRQPTGKMAQADAKTVPVIAAVPEVRRELVRGAIQPGATITSLLGHIFTPQQIHNLNQQCKDVFPLTKLCAGQDYRLALRDGAFERFEYDIDNEEQLIVLQNEEGFDISRSAIPYTVEQQVINGTITSSLFGAVIDSGESEALALNLADIFACDIDFIGKASRPATAAFSPPPSATAAKLIAAFFLRMVNAAPPITMKTARACARPFSRPPSPSPASLRASPCAACIR